MLLSEKANAIDHLLCTCSCRVEPVSEAGVFPLQVLNTLGRDDSLHSRRLQTLQPRLSLQSAAPEGSELVTQVLHELLELREGGYLRPCAVGHQVLLRVHERSFRFYPARPRPLVCARDRGTSTPMPDFASPRAVPDRWIHQKG